MNKSLLEQAQAIESYIKEIFCQVHRNPELGGQEYQTQALILAELNQLGIEATPIADTGVLGIIRGGQPGKTVALRADMDALPMQEETDLDYRSQKQGVMHACGHDAHVAILLGTAKLLSEQKERLCGSVKLFFQPDEEGNGGALRMIQAGCMENPHVEAVFFGHVSAALSVGTIGVRAGSMSAASNPFTVTFRGKGSHGANPELGNDVIVAACQAVVALQTIASRRISPTDSIVVSVGEIRAGTAGNILPESATFSGMMRTLNPATRAKAKKDFKKIIEGVAMAMGVEAEIDMTDGYVATINDSAMAGLVCHSATKVMGSANVHALETPSLTTEDFGYFCEKASGCYYQLGVANEEKGDTCPIHNPRFVVEPKSLCYGVAVYLQIVKDFLGTNEET